jgi:probable F420-dependent oxidoreductase
MISIAVTIPHFQAYADPDVIMTVAHELEAIGVHSLWVSDHIIVRHGATFIPSTFTEPLATLAFLAAATETVGLGTSVLIAPYRHPVFTAKFLSSVDVLSKGRLTVGVGVGWMQEEFDALGIPFSERGARTDETIDVWNNLWTTDPSTFNGRFVQYSDMTLRPKKSPMREGTIPIWVDGPTDAAITRAARVGDGWHPQNRSPQQLRDGVNQYREQCHAFGRTVGTVCMRHTPGARIAPEGGYRFTGDAASCASDLAEYVDAGLEMLMLSFHPTEPQRFVDQIRFFTDEVLPLVTR